MTCGIYDSVEKKSVVYKSLDVPMLSGPLYKLVDFGEVEFRDGMYLWFAPPKRPDDVQNVYIDRIFFTRP